MQKFVSGGKKSLDAVNARLHALTPPLSRPTSSVVTRFYALIYCTGTQKVQLSPSTNIRPSSSLDYGKQVFVISRSMRWPGPAEADDYHNPDDYLWGETRSGEVILCLAIYDKLGPRHSAGQAIAYRRISPGQSFA